MATCPQCGGSKHVFINVRLKLYADGSLTRIYIGKCTLCDPRYKPEPDHKQAQAGER